MRVASSLIIACALGLAAPATRAFAQDASTDKLVADLGADDVKVREDAQKKLEALGKKALPALEKAEKESKDAEVRARAHEAILAIRKARGEDPEAKPGKDEEREGPPLPRERRIVPRMPRMPQGGEEPNFEELFKMFDQGGENEMMKALPKMIEQLQKQMRGFDEEWQQGQGKRGQGRRGNGNMRVFTFGARPKTAIEEKLGVTLEPPSGALQAQLDLAPTDGGLVIEELVPGSPAAKAGLKQYDVVLKLDGNAVRSAADLKGLGGKDAKLEVLRKAKRETITVAAHADEEKPAEPEKGDKPEKRGDEKNERQIRKF